ncbi:putative NAC domain transcriptional regulator superfamily protein [Hibiscus syriacus]|uniref:NAC domain transcriptional regulator superfamily protein n=1 Tax=Hibiscus syriacus TaxID=106335 RepID=A0A6A3AS71_HIBSY|nr:putative NAC domain transcriptional regulator superfamily protein [Hibiscus syriacus]
MVKNSSIRGGRKIEMKKIVKKSNLQVTFSKRHPSVHNINAHRNVIEACPDVNIRELNAHLAQLVEMLEVEKWNGEALDEVREAGRRQWWWQAPVDELRLSELRQLKNALRELKRNVGRRADLLQAVVESSNYRPFLVPGISDFGCEGNEMNAAPCITQMYKFDQDLYAGF